MLSEAFTEVSRKAETARADVPPAAVKLPVKNFWKKIRHSLVGWAERIEALPFSRPVCALPPPYGLQFGQKGCYLR